MSIGPLDERGGTIGNSLSTSVLTIVMGSGYPAAALD
jgi:hypothetical protein